MVKEAIESELHHDTRITTLGHVQRGGSPSVQCFVHYYFIFLTKILLFQKKAFDRFQATVLGVAAVDHLADPSNKGAEVNQSIDFLIF